MMHNIRAYCNTPFISSRSKVFGLGMKFVGKALCERWLNQQYNLSSRWVGEGIGATTCFSRGLRVIGRLVLTV